MRQRHQAGRRGALGKGWGFTLIELLVVMTIIGILLSFILTAAMNGVRSAEKRATEALVTKLEAGMADRIDAILSTRIDPNAAHGYLATAFNGGTPFAASSTTPQFSAVRAQVVARFDQVKAEVPDVFVVQNDPNNNYPLNFGAAPFPATAGTQAMTSTVYDQYFLPFGVGMLNNPPPPPTGTSSFGANPGSVILQTTGIFGASYTAAAGLYKNLYAAGLTDAKLANPALVEVSPATAGFDGIDNNGDGLIDNLLENDSGFTSGGPVATAMIARLKKHTHKTARAEVLYALLVEGQGPFGSSFNRDDFRDTEIKDTDGDGLPEFVDAWGEPIQFYRWPTHYVWPLTVGMAGNAVGGTQKGFLPYAGVSTVSSGSTTFSVSTETRQQNPLDPSQTLIAPVWWGGATGNFNDSAPWLSTPTGAAPLSSSAFAFETLFVPLTDPNAFAKSPFLSNGFVWDRGGTAKRAFYSHFLILSGGPDKTPGVPVLDQAYKNALTANGLVSYAAAPAGWPSFSGASPVAVSTDIDPGKDATIQNIINLRIEGQAAPGTYQRTDNILYSFSNGSSAQVTPPSDAVSVGIQEAGNDDISSHNLQGPGGANQ